MSSGYSIFTKRARLLLALFMVLAFPGSWLSVVTPVSASSFALSPLCTGGQGEPCTFQTPGGTTIAFVGRNMGSCNNCLNFGLDNCFAYGGTQCLHGGTSAILNPGTGWYCMFDEGVAGYATAAAACDFAVGAGNWTQPSPGVHFFSYPSGSVTAYAYAQYIYGPIQWYMVFYGSFPNTPPPTPTPSAPPTKTLTRTPSGPTATRTPLQTPIPMKPPPYSSSSYIALWDSAKGKLDTAALEALGRTEAISETVKGIRDAIVVLHFGYPYRKGDDYGADLLVLTEPKLFFASTEDIQKGAMAFVEAFCGNSSPIMHLSLALGVNDSVQGIGSGHGQAWASMVEEVSKAIRNDRTLCKPFIGAPPRVSVVGAIDVEPSSLITQPIPIDVIRWTEAYSNTTRLPYYNFGTCSNCPHTPPEQPHTLPLVSPLLDDVWTVSWGIPNAFPLPQIYDTKKLNANQWYNLKLYAATCPPLAGRPKATKDGCIFQGRSPNIKAAIANRSL